MDGNFAMAPNVFNQLYVIRAPLGTSAVSCVYALLAGIVTNCNLLFQYSSVLVNLVQLINRVLSVLFIRFPILNMLTII